MNNILNIVLVLPEIFVFSMACVILIVDLFLTEARRGVSYWLSQATLIGAGVLTVTGMSAAPAYAFQHMFVADGLANLLKLAIYGLSFFVFAYSRDYLRSRGMFRGEYFVLALLGVVGMMVMVSASHFLTLYLGLELLSLSVYAMVAFQRDSNQATEAAMKYFVLGALASGILLYGMSMIYGITGSLEIGAVRQAVGQLTADNIILIFGLVFIVVGIAFKLGAGLPDSSQLSFRCG
jgi:NADH-quinone oxidoreductase subunit N